MAPRIVSTDVFRRIRRSGRAVCVKWNPHVIVFSVSNQVIFSDRVHVLGGDTLSRKLNPASKASLPGDRLPEVPLEQKLDRFINEPFVFPSDEAGASSVARSLQLQLLEDSQCGLADLHTCNIICNDYCIVNVGYCCTSLDSSSVEAGSSSASVSPSQALPQGFWVKKLPHF